MKTDYLLIILAMGGATYLTRYGSLALMQATGMPPWLQEWLEQVPVGILTALIIPSLLLSGGRLAINFHNEFLIVGIATAVIAYWSKNPILTMLCGIGGIIILRLLGL